MRGAVSHAARHRADLGDELARADGAAVDARGQVRVVREPCVRLRIVAPVVAISCAQVGALQACSALASAAAGVEAHLHYMSFSYANS